MAENKDITNTKQMSMPNIYYEYFAVRLALVLIAAFSLNLIFLLSAIDVSVLTFALTSNVLSACIVYPYRKTEAVFNIGVMSGVVAILSHSLLPVLVEHQSASFMGKYAFYLTWVFVFIVSIYLIVQCILKRVK